jgi:hypothetical protein
VLFTTFPGFQLTHHHPYKFLLGNSTHSRASHLSGLGTLTPERRRIASAESFPVDAGGDTAAAAAADDDDAAYAVPKHVEDFKRVQIVGGAGDAIDRDTKVCQQNTALPLAPSHAQAIFVLYGNSYAKPFL